MNNLPEYMFPSKTLKKDDRPLVGAGLFVIRIMSMWWVTVLRSAGNKSPMENILDRVMPALYILLVTTTQINQRIQDVESFLLEIPHVTWPLALPTLHWCDNLKVVYGDTCTRNFTVHNSKLSIQGCNCKLHHLSGIKLTILQSFTL